ARGGGGGVVAQAQGPRAAGAVRERGGPDGPVHARRAPAWHAAHAVRRGVYNRASGGVRVSWVPAGGARDRARAAERRAVSRARLQRAGHDDDAILDDRAQRDEPVSPRGRGDSPVSAAAEARAG